MDIKPNKIVLAYSGGLDTSVILKWLIEQLSGCRWSRSAPTSARARSSSRCEGRREAGGAAKIYIDDLREEFVRDFVFPMLRAAPSTSTSTCSAPRSRGR